MTLQESGTISFQTRRVPVAAGDNYSGEINIVAEGAGRATVRIVSGCGSEQDDRDEESYDVVAGENRLAAAHEFAGSANCARFLLIARTPLNFRLASARLVKE